MIKSLCVVGGGTSGLVAALMLRKAWPSMPITIIESSKIGIIGVGEGSTEHWKNFIQHIGVSVPELVRETGATFKVGIKFTNWHGDGTHYFHSLAEEYGRHSPENGVPYVFAKMVSDNSDPNEMCWGHSRDSVHAEPLHNSVSQYHFDTFKLNTFLHKLCSERNIDVIDTEIADVILDESGYVAQLVDKDSRTHAHDFFIDCSGFRRIISSKLGAKWIDCSDQLPMNSAIAFPTGYTEEIPSYTESTALSSGWVWRIPTQERYGNGYVFCDHFIDENKALDEVQHHYTNNLGINETLQVGRKVKFSAGYVDKFWIKNCVSIGLSGIFVEPLEASSIGTTIQQTFLLLHALFHYERGETLTADRYNKDVEGISKNIIDFIQLHYFTQREDTEFWRWCKHNIKMTEFNAEYLEFFKTNFVSSHHFNVPIRLFSQLNYIQVMHGVRLFDIEKIRQRYTHYLDSRYSPLVDNILAENKEYGLKVEKYSHRQALNILKERYDNVRVKF